MSSEMQEIKKKMDEIETRNKDFGELSDKNLVAEKVKSGKFGLYDGKK